MLRSNHRSLNSSVSTALLVLLISSVFACAAQKPSIQITKVPPYDAVGGPSTSATIRGTVQGVGSSSTKYEVVVYTLTNEWWVQPEAASHFTGIRNGVWDATIHTGKRYAVLLMDKEKANSAARGKSYMPPVQTVVLPNDDFFVSVEVVDGVQPDIKK